MLKDSKAFSGFSTDHLEKAKAFYGELLGLDVAESHGLLTLSYQEGPRLLFIPSRTTSQQRSRFSIFRFPMSRAQ